MVKKTDGFYQLNELGLKAVGLMREIETMEGSVDDPKAENEVFSY